VVDTATRPDVCAAELLRRRQRRGGRLIVFALSPFNRRISILATPVPAITEAVTIDGGVDRVELHGGGGAPVSGRQGITATKTGLLVLVTV
jgi:hypothetical protein